MASILEKLPINLKGSHFNKIPYALIISLISFLYCKAVFPVMDLNCLLKWEKLLNPYSKQISVMLSWLSLRSFVAWTILYSFKTSRKLNIRSKPFCSISCSIFQPNLFFVSMPKTSFSPKISMAFPLYSINYRNLVMSVQFPLFCFWTPFVG